MQQLSGKLNIATQPLKGNLRSFVINPLYGKMNITVQPCKYRGISTDTILMNVNSVEWTISASVLKVPHALTIKYGDNEVTFDGSEAKVVDLGDIGVEEKDPIFMHSPAATITNQDIADWNAKQDAIVVEWLEYSAIAWSRVNDHYELSIPYDVHGYTHPYVSQALLKDGNIYSNTLPAWSVNSQNTITLLSDIAINCKLLIKGDL